MRRDDLRDEREAKARAVLARGHEGFENRVDQRLGNARAVVDDLDLERHRDFAAFGLGKPETAFKERADGDRPACFTGGLGGIREQVRENLQQLVLEKNISADKRALLNAEIDREANYLWSIDRMSAWPMDATTRRRYFSVNALVTVVPPAIDMLSRFGDKDSAQAGIWSIMRRAAGMWH